MFCERKRSSPRAFAALAMALALVGVVSSHQCHAQSFDPTRGVVLHGTIVTMDDRSTMIEGGSVYVRNDRIVAIWRGKRPPAGTNIGDARVLDFGPHALIFPGMINLHDHPTFGTQRVWPVPSSQIQPALGRPLGTEPYADRYQWNEMAGNASPELRRLVLTPQIALVAPTALNLEPEVIKPAMIRPAICRSANVS